MAPAILRHLQNLRTETDASAAKGSRVTSRCVPPHEPFAPHLAHYRVKEEEHP
jgi:hypothetical protein